MGFSHFTNAELKDYAERALLELQHAAEDRRRVILNEIAELRREMIPRVADPDDDGDGTGVREPRRPGPGGSEAAVAADTDG